MVKFDYSGNKIKNSFSLSSASFPVDYYVMLLFHNSEKDVLKQAKKEGDDVRILHSLKGVQRLKNTTSKTIILLTDINEKKRNSGRVLKYSIFRFRYCGTINNIGIPNGEKVL